MIKKRYLILGLMFLFLIAGIISVNAAIMHSSTNFMIKVKDATGTLQNAIDGNYFTDFTNTYSSVKTLNPGHGADEIWVSVKDGEKNLIQALQSTNRLCPNPSKPTTYTSSPTDKTKPYHYATEIQLASGKTFQQAINDGQFCCTPQYSFACYNNDVYWYDSCGNRGGIKEDCNYICSNGQCTGACTPGATQTKNCDSFDRTCRDYHGVVIQTCQSDGTWNDPPCNSYTNAAKGTTPCDGSDAKACDGAGNCLGWAGNGRDSCPWGYGSYSCAVGRKGVCYYCYLNGNQGRYYTGDVWTQWSYSEKSAVSAAKYEYCTFWLVRNALCLNWECCKWKYYDWQIKP